MVDARSATAADFDRAANRNASAFWGWFITAGVVWFLAPSWWWALVPGLLCMWNAANSFGATRAAQALRNGTYRIANPNNGAPNGDASSVDEEAHDDEMQAVIEVEATEMYAKTLTRLADRTAQLAAMSASRPSESEQEQMYRMGMADAQQLLADELRKLANKAYESL